VNSMVLGDAVKSIFDKILSLMQKNRVTWRRYTKRVADPIYHNFDLKQDKYWEKQILCELQEKTAFDEIYDVEGMNNVDAILYTASTNPVKIQDFIIYNEKTYEVIYVTPEVVNDVTVFFECGLKRVEPIQAVIEANEEEAGFFMFFYSNLLGKEMNRYGSI